ncbi:MAG: sigma-70 family RNA polymerase sigma factor [Johnsonella sp.]|nr:sigma-70 family RNA polymerase sigma factor [Johnsonella sp.]
MIAKRGSGNIPTAIPSFPMNGIKESTSKRGRMNDKEFREVKKMHCTHCGMKISGNSGFCTHCKNPLQGCGYIEIPAELVAQARNGDQNALAGLYEKTQASLCSSIKYMIRDEDAVSDILQDSYIKAFAGLEKLEGNEKFFPWLKQITLNTAKDWLKKKKPLLFTELEYEDETGQRLPAEDRFLEERSEFIPEKLVESNETTRLLREIVDTLPENQRAVIAMFYYEELSVKQIAALTESSESAVKSRLMYGRQKIESKVRDLEKSGTKLYGLAPISFFLLLLRSEKSHAAELFPNQELLQNILERSVSAPFATEALPSMKNTALNAGAPQSAAAGIGKAVSSAATFSAAKIALFTLSAIALIGTGAFGLSKLFQHSSDPIRSEQNAAPSEKPAKKKTEKSKKQSTKNTPRESSAKAESKREPSDPENKAQPQSETKKALEQYRKIVAKAESYTYDPYGESTPTGNYRYALVQMQTGDRVPTLLLSQETTDSLYFVRIFRYDPDSDILLEPSESLTEGVAMSGGYRGALSMMEDGKGIRIAEASSGNGSFTILRALAEKDTINISVQWQGFIGDPVPETFKAKEIEWHDIKETRLLEDGGIHIPSPIETPPVSESPTTEAALPDDGDRIVFRGIIREYSYAEVLALQNQADPNPSSGNQSEVFRLIVLDTPQNMKLRGLQDLSEREVSLIDVSSAPGLESCYNQPLTFSIDPQSTYWPSDTSLPLGQPRTGDVKILN